MDNLTWTCHVCGDERPDAAISVFKIDTSESLGLPPGTFQQNIRYCNDRRECVEQAPGIRHVEEG